MSTGDVIVEIEDTQPEIVVENSAVGLKGDPGSVDLTALTAHISDVNPHPNYDDGSSFLLRYENAKV